MYSFPSPKPQTQTSQYSSLLECNLLGVQHAVVLKLYISHLLLQEVIIHTNILMTYDTVGLLYYTDLCKISCTVPCIREAPKPPLLPGYSRVTDYQCSYLCMAPVQVHIAIKCTVCHMNFGVSYNITVTGCYKIKHGMTEHKNIIKAQWNPG